MAMVQFGEFGKKSRCHSYYSDSYYSVYGVNPEVFRILIHYPPELAAFIISHAKANMELLFRPHMISVNPYYDEVVLYYSYQVESHTSGISFGHPKPIIFSVDSTVSQGRPMIQTSKAQKVIAYFLCLCSTRREAHEFYDKLQRTNPELYFLVIDALKTFNEDLAVGICGFYGPSYLLGLITRHTTITQIPRYIRMLKDRHRGKIHVF